jgi:hypothetical protein
MSAEHLPDAIFAELVALTYAACARCGASPDTVGAYEHARDDTGALVCARCEPSKFAPAWKVLASLL